MRNTVTASFVVGYEPEFKAAGVPTGPQAKKRRAR
jgi:hypothetical protein